MPNKDSFTFSDKLKKSKSLPLSKRIPSRVGGDGKAKRTLIQRAQRDLPFIIVAAAALLLLPLLSRNSGTDATGFEGSGYDDFVGESLYDYPSSGDGEIVPSTGYRDPMDYIITNRSGMDTPSLSDSYDSEDTSSYISHAQSSYEEEKPQREIYKNVAKPSIRNAVQRKATAIGAFRNRAMSFGNSSSGLTRNLAIGGAPTTTGTAAARVGVRPVALQPLSSAGKGRVLTGEGLYAEAARSLGALNQGSAKQALFEAQLRDVDGAPLGAAGDPRRAAARIGSQGGVPDHKFGYTNERPWWWDMMKERSQKMWELWNYNWQKALSDSLIKVSTNLAMCLLTGSEDGSVKNFLGIKGGSKDICCLVDGMELCAGDIGDYTSSTSGSGDSKETTNNSFSSIQSFCDSHGAKTYVSESGAKNALQARLECMGLKAGKLAWASGTNYAGSCADVNKTPMVYKATATRKADGKVRDRKNEKIVVYVKAKPRENIDTKTANNEFVIALEKTNEFALSAEELKAINTNCEITRVGSFVSKNTKRKISNKVGQYNDDKESITEENAEENSDKLKSGRYTKQEEKNSSEGGELKISEYIIGKVNDQYNYCISENAVKPAEFIDEDDIMEDIKVKTEINEVCPIWYSDGMINDRTVNNINCNTQNAGTRFVEIDKLSKSTFSVDVKNPKDYIYAIFLEEVQSAQDQNGKKGVILKHYVKDTAEAKSAGNHMVHSNVKEGKNGRIASATYTVPYYRAGKSTESTQSNTVGSVPGNGVVFWLMTNKEKPIVDVGHVFEGKVISEIRAEDLIGPTAGYKEGYCVYSWGCNGSECPEHLTGTFCKEDGKLYNASPHKGYYFKTDITPLSTEKIKEYAASDKECGEDVNKFIEKQPICSPICKHKTGKYGILPDKKDLELELNSSIVAQEVLDECPDCNPEMPAEDRIISSPEKCKFNVSSTFCTNQFTKFGVGSSSKCQNMEEAVTNEIEDQTDALIDCLQGDDLKIGLYGWTSQVGGKGNKGLSQARALKVAQIVYKRIKQRDPDLNIAFEFPEDFTGKPGFGKDKHSLNAEGKPNYSEEDYISDFKTNSGYEVVKRGAANQYKEAFNAVEDEYYKLMTILDEAKIKLNNYNDGKISGNVIINKLSQPGLEQLEAEISSLKKEIPTMIAGSKERNEKRALLREKEAEYKEKLAEMESNQLTEEEKNLPEYKAYIKAKGDLSTFEQGTYAEALRKSRRLIIYVSGQGASAGSKADEHWAKCIAGKVINDNDYTPQPCRQ